MRASAALFVAGLVAATEASDIFLPRQAHEQRDLVQSRKVHGKKRMVEARGDWPTSAGALFTPLAQAAQPLVKVSNAANNAVASASSLLATSTDFAGNWLKRNCVYWGWFPGDWQKLDNGQFEYPSIADDVTGINAKYFGMYAHVNAKNYVKGDPSTYFDGSEILHWTHDDYLGGSKSIPVLSIMPTYGFAGMTWDDNNQAKAIAQVVKHFSDAGLTPYVRFGHEMNWYFHSNSDDLRDGGSFYRGSASDYIEAWQVVHDAIKSAAPNAQMYWCPIRAWDEGSNYAQYWPGAKYVDVVGVDYYPNTTNDYNQIAKYVQDIHDTYAKANGYPFMIGETGTTLDAAAKVHWASVVTSKDTCSALSNLVGVMWFDIDHPADGGDFRLLASASTASNFVSMMESW